MSVRDEVPKSSEYTGNAETTEFTYGFYAPDLNTVKVKVNSALVEPNDPVYGYTVTSDSTGDGKVTFNTAPADGTKIQMFRSTPITQTVDLKPNESFYPETLNSSLDKMTMILQEIRGGEMTTFASAGYATSAGTAGYAGSAGDADYATSAGALVNGATVGYADAAGYADVAGGLSSGAVVSSALVAASAMVVDSTERNNIIDSAVASAGGSASVIYDGPFALQTDGSGGAMTAGMNSGYVYAGGSQYLISAFDSDHVSFGDGDTLYLTLLSSGGAISSGLVTSPSGTPEGTVVVRVASRMPDSDETKQLQYGNITTVPWGLTGGGGTVNAYVTEVSDSMYAPTAGILFGQAYMDETQGAGNSAVIQIGTSSYKYGIVPEHGTTTDFSSGAVGCMIMRPVSAGQLIAKSGSMNAKVYFLGFGQA